MARLRTFIVLTVATMVTQLLLVATWQTSPDGSIDKGVADVVGIAYALLGFGWIVLFYAYRIAVYRRLESCESRDDSGAPLQPSDEIRGQGDLLSSLGFRLLGQYAYRMPWQTWKSGWVFSHPDLGIEVRLSRGKPLSLASRWADEYQLITMRDWPGRVVDLPGAKLVATRGSVMSIYEKHARESAGISLTRGRPVAMTSLGQALALDVQDLPLSKAIVRANAKTPAMLLAYVAGAAPLSFLLASALHLI